MDKFNILLQPLIWITRVYQKPGYIKTQVQRPGAKIFTGGGDLKEERGEERYCSILEIVSAAGKSTGDVIMDLNVLGLISHYHHTNVLPLLLIYIKHPLPELLCLIT